MTKLLFLNEKLQTICSKLIHNKKFLNHRAKRQQLINYKNYNTLKGVIFYANNRRR